VQFVDEEDDFAFAGGDFAEDGLEAFFELAAELGAGEQLADIEGDDAGVAHGGGAVAVDDAQGDAFGDGGLAHARLADEDGVVLGAAAEDLDAAADFVIAADDGIELAGLGEFDEVDARTCSKLRRWIRICRGVRTAWPALTAADCASARVCWARVVKRSMRMGKPPGRTGMRRRPVGEGQTPRRFKWALEGIFRGRGCQVGRAGGGGCGGGGTGEGCDGGGRSGYCYGAYAIQVRD
jgi:hypothetical protein